MAADENSPFIIYFEESALEIPQHILDLPLSELPIQGCKAMIRKLNQQAHCVCVRDLPGDLSVLVHRLKGAGPMTVRKFFTELQDFILNKEREGKAATGAVAQQCGSRPARESGAIRLKDRVLEMDAADCELVLKEEWFPRTPALIKILHRAGIAQAGNLPSNLEKLLKYDGVGEKVLDKFWHQLEHRLNEHRLKRQEDQRWQNMSEQERIEYALSRVEAAWAVKLSEEQIRRQRNLQMVYLRWKEQKEGRKATLEWLGQQYGLTRERVRQIIRSVLRKYYEDVILLEKALKEACRQNNGYYRYPMDVSGSFAHFLIKQVIEERKELVYLEWLGWWTDLPQAEAEKKAAGLRKRFQEWMRGNIVTLDEIRSALSQFSEPFPKELALQLVLSDLHKTPDGRYISANSKKYDIAEMVLRQYPEGVEVYKRARELCEQANRIRPGFFARERDFTSIFQRDEFSDKAYMWGRGTYIHHSFVKADLALVREAACAGAALLEKRSPISVGRLFQMFQERLIRGGIPNEYALYTMLRKYGTDKLAPNKFPHIWHKDDTFRLSNAELIKMFLRERKGPLEAEMLREEFVRKRGWKKFMLDFAIANDADFVSVDYGVIGLREFYPHRAEDFAPILRLLPSLLEETGVIHVNRLFESAKSQCEKMGIPSPYLLYDLLKTCPSDDFRFVRYPLIAKAGHPLEGATLLTLVEQFLEDQEAEVPRELVYQWVTEEVGAREATLDNVLTVSTNIFYYRGGQFGEYIHRNRLGWTQEKEDALADYAGECLNKAAEQGRHFVTIGEIWAPHRFPPLPHDLEWTEDLLADCLRKSGKFLLLGSLNAIIASAENARIKDETDLITSILEKEFNGRASLSDLQRRLAEIKYSKDGTFLIGTAALLEKGAAPFAVESGYVSLKGRPKGT